jgi:hypothetical protein
MLRALRFSHHHGFFPQVSNRPKLAFEFDGQDLVARGSFLVEPSGACIAVIGLKNAKRFAIGEVEETAVFPYVGIVLEGIGNFASVLEREAVPGKRVHAHASLLLSQHLLDLRPGAGVGDVGLCQAAASGLLHAASHRVQPFRAV